MATVTNTLVGSGVVPKFLETGVWAIECSQAIASGAASATTYELFYVCSGCKVLDLKVCLATAASTAASKINVGHANDADAYLATIALDSAWALSATGAGTAGWFAVSAFTADTKITADLVGATTAATNLYVRAIIAKADELS